MIVSEELFDKIKKIDINEHKTVCDYSYWESYFTDDAFILGHIKLIKQSLGEEFNRDDIVSFFGLTQFSEVTKFIAVMIWGHEATKGGRRDSRGPWKLSKMFEKTLETEKIIKSVSVDTKDDIKKSYKILNSKIPRCGPNFFTKYFYFLGKSKLLKNYPIIFDDRVANGLVKLITSNNSNLNLVQVSTLRKPKAYLEYLDYANSQASRIGCELDQFEYYLFKL